MTDKSTSKFACPYLGGNVELSSEREAHIAERHPELLPIYRSKIAEVLAHPDEVRSSERLGNSKMFSRYFDDVLKGKHIVVVVVSDITPERHWIVTAYITRRLSGGTTEWKRS